MFERFTDRARRVVVHAQGEAKALHHSYIGTEHLLLGLIHEGDGVAAKVLLRLGVNLDQVRVRVVDIIGRGTQPPTDHIPFTPRAKKVLELALREALQLGHNYIGVEHILLGIAREGNGVAAQVLTKLGVDPARLRHAVITELDNPSDWLPPMRPLIELPVSERVSEVIVDVAVRRAALVVIFEPKSESDKQVAKLMKRYNAALYRLQAAGADINELLEQRDALEISQSAE